MQKWACPRVGVERRHRGSVILIAIGILSFLILADDLTPEQEKNLDNAKRYIEFAEREDYIPNQERSLSTISKYLDPLLKEIPDHPDVRPCLQITFL